MEEGREWIREAESDLEAARILRDGSKENISAFHLQQAVEKALKGLLLDTEGDYPYIHNLVELSKDIDPPDRFLDAFSELNPVYYSTRYPDQTGDKVENLEKLTTDVEEFIEWATEQLEE